ncbi:MAG: alanine dehydrogenase [Microbacteriaceae bacterium]|nr:alanine dehydrogenase [Microbacteriaceae bacterium]
MRIGIPTEVKDSEARVAITPAGVKALVENGHQILIQSGAGDLSGIRDEEYVSVGAEILADAEATWSSSEMVLKVKEPIKSEYKFLREDLTLFTFLHLAAEPDLTDALLKAGTTAIAYETVQIGRQLPLLAPMSEVAGRLAPQVGASTLQKNNGGLGVLLGGVPGTRSAKVVVLGGGVSGTSAIEISLGMGAQVTVLDTSIPRLRELEAQYGGRLNTIFSNTLEIEKAISDADLVIGAVLIPGAKAPKLITNQMVSQMREGSVLVDIAIDQGGCFEDSKPTTHHQPTFKVHGSVFYCVTNMPGAVPNTSTFALTNATMPYVLKLANMGWKQAISADESLRLGLNTHSGKVYNSGVADAHGLSFADSRDL